MTTVSCRIYPTLALKGLRKAFAFDTSTSIHVIFNTEGHGKLVTLSVSCYRGTVPSHFGWTAKTLVLHWKVWTPQSFGIQQYRSLLTNNVPLSLKNLIWGLEITKTYRFIKPFNCHVQRGNHKLESDKGQLGKGLFHFWLFSTWRVKINSTHLFSWKS